MGVSVAPVVVFTLVAVVVVFAAAFAAELYTDSWPTFRALPAWAKLVVAGLAFGPPWWLEERGLFPEPFVDDSVFALAVSLAIWVGLPLVLGRWFVDEPAPAEVTC